MESREIVPINIEDYAMTTDGVVKQVTMIQEVMEKVMRQDEHFGTIPGTAKPTLLKPGAEKLILTFRFSTEYQITRNDLPQGHREYEVVCTLKHMPTQMFIGEGVGNCTTMESRYRYRKGEATCPECGKEGTVIRGKKEYGGGWLCWAKKGGCGAKFKDGDTVIENQDLGKYEYENPADYYNTVLKIAKKRAQVDAVLSATAASDIFTQDLEDLPQPTDAGKPDKPATDPPPSKKPSTPDKKPSKRVGPGNCTKKQYGMIVRLGLAHWPDDGKDFVDNSIGNLCQWFRSGEKLSKAEASQIIDTFHVLVCVSQTFKDMAPQEAWAAAKKLIEFWKDGDPGREVTEKDMLGIAQNWDEFLMQYEAESQMGGFGTLREDHPQEDDIPL